MIGKIISHYKILEKLGEGGMGVVYKAEDTKLERTVALKFLSSTAIAGDGEKKRFKREAKAAAALNHPNIATIFAIDEAEPAPAHAGGQTFIAMEFIEGQSLAEMVASPLPLDKAMDYATQISAGLQAAHEKGIVHRDIKSANVMVTDKGVVKIMDFGLASLAGGSKVTQLGTTLGTAAYMPPEQARGEKVDHRADIWALGVVLYEMVSGQLPFKGDYEQAVIYSILNEDPEPLTALRTGVPVALDGIVAKALAKDRDTRYQHVDELPADLKVIDLESPQSSRVMRTTTLRISRASKDGGSFSSHGVSWRLALPLALVATTIAFAAAWFIKPNPAATPTKVQRFILPSSHGEQYERDFAVSPDGKQLAYIGTNEKGRRIFHRRMDEFQAEPLPGTEDAHRLFFSSDGRSIGFVAQHKLKKISTMGGSPQVICDVFDWHFGGASWVSKDTIILGLSDLGLAKVSTAGGSPQLITDADNLKYKHVAPHLLPGGTHVLLSGGADRETEIALLELQTKKQRILLNETGNNAQYLPTGHILYHRSGSLMAVPFNLDKLEITGSPVLVLENISKAVVADDGSLFYVPALRENKKLVWVDRNGVASPLMEQAHHEYLWPRISPDGKRVAFGESQVLWIYDIDRRTRTRFTIEGRNGEPIWTPDGKRLTFWSNTDQTEDERLFSKAADGSGQAELLLEDELQTYPGSWSPDGQTVVFYGTDAAGQSDIWVLPRGGSPRAIINTRFTERVPMFSPDGRWLAYVSDESGRKEVYVQPYPTLDKRWLISNDGGNEPTWRGDGKELFYRNGYKMMAVSIHAEPEFRAGTPQLLFEAEYDLHRYDDRNYDVTRDGQRFAMIQSEGLSEKVEIHVVLNWFEELKEKMQEAE